MLDVVSSRLYTRSSELPGGAPDDAPLHCAGPLRVMWPEAFVASLGRALGVSVGRCDHRTPEALGVYYPNGSEGAFFPYALREDLPSDTALLGTREYQREATLPMGGCNAGAPRTEEPTLTWAFGAAPVTAELCSVSPLLLPSDVRPDAPAAGSAAHVADDAARRLLGRALRPEEHLALESDAATGCTPPCSARAYAEVVTWSPDGTVTSAVPRDVVELFATRIQPTCSLNDGVCHASKNAPDLTSVASLLDAAFAPCRSPNGAKLPGCAEIAPGRPDQSFLVARLWDDALDPELMPRQCRAWDDMATRALGCWIEGLVVADDGKVAEASAFAPIDYARCTFRVAKPGRCGGGAPGVDAVFRANYTGCHAGRLAAAGLDLTGTPGSLAVSLARPSGARPDVLLVAPGDPGASWLFRKITNDAPAIDGARMRLGGALTSADVEAVRSLIAGLVAP